MRIPGAEEIREGIRNHVHLAKRFAKLINNDIRFEITCKPTLGLVCFRLKVAVNIQFDWLIFYVNVKIFMWFKFIAIIN